MVQVEHRADRGVGPETVGGVASVEPVDARLVSGRLEHIVRRIHQLFGREPGGAQAQVALARRSDPQLGGRQELPRLLILLLRADEVAVSGQEHQLTVGTCEFVASAAGILHTVPQISERPRLDLLDVAFVVAEAGEEPDALHRPGVELRRIPALTDVVVTCQGQRLPRLRETAQGCSLILSVDRGGS